MQSCWKAKRQVSCSFRCWRAGVWGAGGIRTKGCGDRGGAAKLLGEPLGRERSLELLGELLDSWIASKLLVSLLKGRSREAAGTRNRRRGDCGGAGRQSRLSGCWRAVGRWCCLFPCWPAKRGRRLASGRRSGGIGWGLAGESFWGVAEGREDVKVAWRGAGGREGRRAVGFAVGGPRSRRGGGVRSAGVGRSRNGRGDNLLGELLKGG